jgi:integrase
MKVNLREKKLKNGRRSLYLDFYPPVIADGIQTRREFLSLYIFEKPKTELERAHNKETRLLAETIRSKRQLDLQANPHGFISRRRKNADFLDFFRKLINQKQSHSAAAIATWEAILNHLTDFCGGSCTFAQVDASFVERFRDYLLTCEPHKTKTGKPSAPRKPPKKLTLSRNTAKSYFNRFTSIVRKAREENYLSSDPTAKIESIKGETPTREFLTIEELRILAQTVCDIPDNLRRAALFSALTGLRHSDIENLTWANVRCNSENDTVLHFKIKKTGERLVLPISEEARELLGTAGNPAAQVFKDLKYDSMTLVYIERWTTAAGITRRVGFHAFRRTFATAQITLGTDLYTIQKMLGHSSVQQTQIYAHLLDAKKKEAANKISLK